MSSTLFVSGVSVSAAPWFNDVDTAAYNYLTSVSGTNTITATGPTSMTAYAAGQMFKVVPAATNSGATTLNINSIGAKNVFYAGAACVGGEIVISVPVLVLYDGTQFNIIGNRPLLRSVTNSLGSDVSLSDTGAFFTGPSTAQGTSGTWFASGSVTLHDTAGAANFYAKLWDGTTVIASGFATSSGTSNKVVISLSGYLAGPAGNIRISVQDINSTSGVILFNATGASKDSTLSVIRIA